MLILYDRVVYMNKKIISILLLSLLLLVTFNQIDAINVNLSNEEERDVTQENIDGGSTGNGLCHYDDILAQSFQTSVNEITKIALRLRKIEMKKLEKVILTLSRSKEGNALGTTLTFCAIISDGEDGGWCPFIFENPVKVVPGNIYWIKITLMSDPDDDRGRVIWLSSNHYVYDIGRSYVYSDSIDWNERRNKDQAFATYGYKTSERNDKEHYAVIICGGEDGGDGQSEFEMDACMVYDSFKDYLGYNDDHIYYLNRNDNFGNRVDDPTTEKNCKYAIKNWLSQATSKSKIFIYITDHGTPSGSVLINEGEYISKSELNNWVSNLNYQSLTIMIQCCYSGNFLNALKGTNRIILAASADNKTAHYNPFGCSMFTGSIVASLRSFSSYGFAFDLAEGAVSSYVDPSISDVSKIADTTYPGYTKDYTKTKQKTTFFRLVENSIIMKILNFILKFF